MAIVKMKKIAAAVHAADLDAFVSDLTWLGAVEIASSEDKTEDNDGIFKSERTDVSEDIYAAEKKLSDLTAAINALSAYRTGKKGLFTPKQDLIRDNIDMPGDSYSGSLTVAGKTVALLRKQNELKNEKNKLTSLNLSLMPWETLDVPLNLTGTKKSSLILGVIPVSVSNSENFTDKLSGLIPVDVTEISKTAEFAYLALLVHTDDEYDLNMQLSTLNFSKITFKDISVTAAKKIAETTGKIKEIEREEAELDRLFRKMADELPLLEAGYDITLAKQTKLLLKQKFLSTGSSYFIEGYVPENKIADLDGIVQKYSAYHEVYDVDIENNAEDIPVLLKNNKFAEPFESIVGLYSYPAYTGIDPTAIMAVFYFVIFGMMLNDFLYGLILAAGGFFGVRLLRLRGGTRRFVLALAISGVSSMICGILFGGYFGDMPAAIAKNLFGYQGEFRQALVLDPLADPVAYLILSIVVGAVHLFTGMGIKIYMLIKRGEILDAIFGVGMWYLIFGGLALSLVNPSLIYITLAGVAGMALMKEHREKNIILRIFKGIFGLYDSIAYISDLLSYARILALGLSGAVIAMVVNLIGTMAGPPVGFISLLIAIAIGHTLNIALSTLGAFVHAARLQYIEFFGKFYEDGGRPFAPVELKSKYTNIIYEEEK